jgi:hypothetical protein
MNASLVVLGAVRHKQTPPTPHTCQSRKPGHAADLLPTLPSPKPTNAPHPPTPAFHQQAPPLRAEQARHLPCAPCITPP